jgi:DNA-binding response OmpR family regulator
MSEPTKRRVLVIDDNPDIRNTIQWLLEGEGFVVSLAENGRDGLGLQRRQPADLVVTDIFMPEQDGIETIWQLRKEFPHVPIIVISGGSAAKATTDYSVVARELGAKKTLRKPFDPQELIDVVHQITRSPLS